jgi:hypothetical protein
VSALHYGDMNRLNARVQEAALRVAGCESQYTGARDGNQALRHMAFRRALLNTYANSDSSAKHHDAALVDTSPARVVWKRENTHSALLHAMLGFLAPAFLSKASAVL